MASTNKTSLGFNQWISTDKPKWADFNADNTLLDSELKKRAEIDADGRVKQEAKNSQAFGGKSYSQLFDAYGAAKNAIALGGHTYSQLFDETGAVQNTLNFNGQAFISCLTVKIRRLRQLTAKGLEEKAPLIM